MQLGLAQPCAARTDPARPARGIFGADFAVDAGLGLEVDPDDGAVTDRRIAQHARAELHPAPRQPRRRTAPCGELAQRAFGLVIDDDEHRVERRIAPEDRLAEADRARRGIDVVIDVPRHLRAGEDPVGPDPVAHFEPQLVAVGDDVAARQAIRPRQAVALDLVAAMELIGIGGKGAEHQPVALIFGLHAVERAAVARQLRVGQPGLEIAEQRVEVAPLEPQIELALRRRVIALRAAVAIDGVIAIGVDLAEQPAATVDLAVAVIGERHQPRSLDPPLGIESELAVGDHAAAHPRRQRARPRRERVIADRPGPEADHHPVARRGGEPGAHVARPHRLFLRQADHGVDRAGVGRRLKRDEGETVVAGDARGGLRAPLAGELARLVELDLDRGGIGLVDLERDERAVAHRMPGPVGDTHCDQRARHAIGDEPAGGGNEHRAIGKARRPHRPRQRRDHAAIGRENARLDAIVAVLQRDPRPARERDRLLGIDVGRVEQQRIDQLAIDRKRDALPRQMLDDDARDRRARVVVGGREQQRHARLLARHPVAVARRIGAARDADRQRLGGRGLHAGRAQLEVDALEQAALGLDEARDRAARGARVAVARHRLIGWRNAVRVHLDDVTARPDALDMVIAVAVGRDIGAVLEQQADPGNALAPAIGVAAAALGNAADQREAVGEQQRRDPHRRRGFVARRAGIARGEHAIDRLARRRARRDRDDIAHVERRPARNRGNGEIQPTPVARYGRLDSPTRRAAFVAQPERQDVGQMDTERSIAPEIGERDAILHEIPRRRLAHRGGLGQQQAGVADAVDGHVDIEGIGRRQREGATERPVVDQEARPLRVLDRRQLGGRPGRGRDIGRRRLDLEMVRAERDIREAIIALREGIGPPARIGRRRAADDARRIAADAVVAEHGGRLVIAVEQGHADPVDQGSARRIKDIARRVDQHRIGRAIAIRVLGEAQRQMLAAHARRITGRGRRIASRLGHAAGEDAGIGSGLEQRDATGIAFGRDGDDRLFALERIAIAAGVFEHQDQRDIGVERLERWRRGERRGIDRRGGELERRRRLARQAGELIAHGQQAETERGRALRAIDIDGDGVGRHRLPAVRRIEAERRDVRDARDILRRRGGDGRQPEQGGEGGKGARMEHRPGVSGAQDSLRAEARSPWS